MRIGAGGNTYLIIDGDGHMTNASQSAFSATPTNVQYNIANNDIVTFDTERFDQNGDFASNAFTAPVTGKYMLSVNIRVDNIDSSGTWIAGTINTSNKAYNNLASATMLDTDSGYYFFSITHLCDMDANDTANVLFNKSGGSDTGDVSTSSYFSGVLVC